MLELAWKSSFPCRGSSVPLATGSCCTLRSEWPVPGSPNIIPRDVGGCAWGDDGRSGGGGSGEDGMTGGEREKGVARRGVLWRSLFDPRWRRPSESKSKSSSLPASCRGLYSRRSRPPASAWSRAAASFRVDTTSRLLPGHPESGAPSQTIAARLPPPPPSLRPQPQPPRRRPNLPVTRCAKPCHGAAEVHLPVLAVRTAAQRSELPP